MAGRFWSPPSRKPAKDFEVEVVGTEVGLGRPVRSVQLFYIYIYIYMDRKLGGRVCKYMNLSSNLEHPPKESGMASHACDPSMGLGSRGLEKDRSSVSVRTSLKTVRQGSREDSNRGLTERGPIT